jgi:hypothetical protein
MNRTAWLFGVTSIAMLTNARTAHALGPVDVEIGAKIGGATSVISGVNPLGFGLGGRAGVVLFDHLYGGINLVYYFGGSATVPSGALGEPSYDLSGHTLVYGVEAGWGFKVLDILTIRPQVGLGNATISETISCPGSGQACGVSNIGESSLSSLYVEPGVTVLVALGTFFVGADANAFVLTGVGSSIAAFTAHGQVGVKF